MNDEDITLALSTLIYKSEFSENENLKGKNVYEVVTILKQDLVKEYENGNINTSRADGDQYMTDAEWMGFYNYVLQNKTTFSKLTINDISYDYGNTTNDVKDKKALDKQMVVSSVDKTYVIYRGTGNLEWHDNADGMQSGTKLTKQQQTAINYYNNRGKELAEGNDIVIGGHSKGGNKASIVGYLYGDEISGAYSFDGQGVSASFYKNYLKQIRSNKDKVKSIAAQNDYVNILGIRIGETKYTGYGKGFLGFFGLGTIANTLSKSIDEAKAQHAPYAMFENGTYTAEVGSIAKRRKTDGVQDSTLKMLGSLVQYSMLNMKDEDFEYLSHYIMHMLDSGNCSIDFDPTKMPEGFIERSKEVFKNFGKYRLGLSGDKLDSFVATIQKSIEDTSKDGWFGLQKVGGWIDAYRHLMSFLDQNSSKVIAFDTERDYTQKTQDDFLKIVSDVEDENPWDFTKWDAWTRLEDSQTKITLENCNKDTKAYYRKLVDIRDVTEKSANDIFDKVYKRDEEFCDYLTILGDSLDDINNSLISLIEKLSV